MTKKRTTRTKWHNLNSEILHLRGTFRAVYFVISSHGFRAPGSTSGDNEVRVAPAWSNLRCHVQPLLLYRIVGGRVPELSRRNLEAVRHGSETRRGPSFFGDEKTFSGPVVPSLGAGLRRGPVFGLRTYRIPTLAEAGVGVGRPAREGGGSVSLALGSEGKTTYFVSHRRSLKNFKTASDEIGNKAGDPVCDQVTHSTSSLIESISNLNWTRGHRRRAGARKDMLIETSTVARHGFRSFLTLLLTYSKIKRREKGGKDAHLTPFPPAIRGD